MASMAGSIFDVASMRKQNPPWGRRNSAEHVRPCEGQWPLATMVRKIGKNELTMMTASRGQSGISALSGMHLQLVCIIVPKYENVEK
jgi:hypothetical protein